MKKTRKDWKNRPFILNKDFDFREVVDDVEVYVNWENLKIIPTKWKEQLQSKYDRAAQENIFHKLWLLQYGKFGNLDYTDKKQKERINKAIEKGITDWQKKQNSRVVFITAVDQLFGTGTNENPYDFDIHNILVEQVTYNSIVVLDEELYHTKWFRQLDLSQVSEFRILSKQVNFNTSDNVKWYTSIDDLLRRAKDDYRQIVVLGGETVFRYLYPSITELYITFITGNIKQERNRFFTKVELHNFELDECANYELEENNILLQPTHLHKIKNRQTKWSFSVCDKRFQPVYKKRTKKATTTKEEKRDE